MSIEEIRQAVTRAKSPTEFPDTVSPFYYVGSRYLSFSIAALERALTEHDNLVDEHHTMGELYEYRMLYNAMAANAMPSISVKSKRHHDGNLCFGGGWFIVYMHLPTGQVSNHYKMEHWDMFVIPEVHSAPEWDGHNAELAAYRLKKYLEGYREYEGNVHG